MGTRFKSLIALLAIVAATTIDIGCSTAPPVEVALTSNIEATVEAKLGEEQALDAKVKGLEDVLGTWDFADMLAMMEVCYVGGKGDFRVM